MRNVALSFILDIMNVKRDISNMEEQYKVRAIDAQIRKLRRKTVFPWMLKKGSLRVFEDVLEYPVASDHDELGFIDSSKIDSYRDSLELLNTSMPDFYNKVNASRNVLAEIWDNGVCYLGIDDKQINSSGGFLLSSAENVDDYSVSGDATSVALDNVVYKKGNGSMRINLTMDTGTATIKNTITETSDSLYKRRYHFRYIYIGATAPTGIQMRLQTDDTNYLYKNITTQFSGQAFKTNQWNLIAYDLNEADEEGTFDNTSIGSEVVVLTITASDTYYLDQSNLRSWELLDYWYYSRFNVISDAASEGDKEFFIDTTESTADIDTADKLIGDYEWVDLIAYGANKSLFSEVENVFGFRDASDELAQAQTDFDRKYPNLIPVIVTSRVQLDKDPGQHL